MTDETSTAETPLWRPDPYKQGYGRGLTEGMRIGREAEHRYHAEFLSQRPDLWEDDEVAEAYRKALSWRRPAAASITA